MFESNTFRSFMLVAGVIIFGVSLIFFFKFPVVKFDENDTHNETYHQMMMIEDKTELTPFDITLFYVKAIPRGDVKHY